MTLINDFLGGIKFTADLPSPEWDSLAVLHSVILLPTPAVVRFASHPISYPLHSTDHSASVGRRAHSLILAGYDLQAFMMKVSVLSLSSYAFSLLSGLVHSFPTARNFARFALHDSISDQNMHESLLLLREKRLLSNPMTEPVDGASYDGDEKSLNKTDKFKLLGTILSSRQISTMGTSEGLVLDSMHLLIMVTSPAMVLLA